jgi:hypothetical protein
VNALANVLSALHRVLVRMAEAAPVAWRHDPLFCGASIGAGVTLALLLLRFVGPHNPELDAPVAALRSVPGIGMRGAPSVMQPPTDVPKIAPGHPLSDVTVAPIPDSDRFGTFTPGKHP